MDISSIGFRNYKTPQLKKNTNNSDYTPQVTLQSQPVKDTVQFTGAVKILSNAYDKAFANILERDLELTKEFAVKLKNEIWNFLREHKIQSLSDIQGEEFFNEQVELQGRIMKKLNLPEEKSEYVAHELFRRCEDGEKYIPSGLIGFQKEKEAEFHMMKFDMKNLIKTIGEQEADKEFYEYARVALRLSPDENYEFRATIENYLKEQKLKSITDLAGESKLNEQAELVEKLKTRFDLSDAEADAIQWELISRANSNIDYVATASRFIKDSAALETLVKRGGYDYIVNERFGLKFSDKLFVTMNGEAEEKNYKNLFEIFLKENNPQQSETMKFINSSELSAEQKTDLILDLTKAAKNPEELIEAAPKHALFDNFYCPTYTDMISERIRLKYDIPALVEDNIKDIIRKIHPKHVEGGEDISAIQAAYEIADKYKLPSGAEKEIESIISEVLTAGRKEADVYIFNKITQH